MENYYNKHYIDVDDLGRILDGWSDGPNLGKDTEGAICINEQGGYQFRLIINGELTEENPSLYDFNGIPLYKYVDGEIVKRSDEEIEADRLAIPDPAPTEMEKIRADIDFIAAMGGIDL